MAKGKGKKTQSKSGKKPKQKNRPMIQLPGQYSMMDSSTATPDVDYPYRHRYPQPTTFDVSEFYIPMKVFPFTAFRDLSQMCKDTDYNAVQKCELFQQSLSDDQIIDDIISNDPEKSNKVSDPNLVCELCV